MIKDITDPAARMVVYHLQLQIDLLTLEIEKLKKNQSADGIQVKESERSMDTAFKTVRHYVPD